MPEEDKQPKWYWCAAGAKTEDDLSALAVLETILAIGLTTAIGVWLNWWEYLLLASMVAPFLLLRTERSVNLGIALFNPAVRWSTSKLPGVVQFKWHPSFFGSVRSLAIVTMGLLWSLTLHALYYTLIPLVSMGIKVFATASCVLLHPLQSIAAIPGNWKRACLHVDSTKGLELMPGVDLFPHGPLFLARMNESMLQQKMSFMGLFRTIFCLPKVQQEGHVVPLFLQQSSLIWQWSVYTFLALVVLFFLVPSIVPLVIIVVAMIAAHVLAWWYRWSLKSTAIVWLPLLYIAADVAPRNWSAERRLRTIYTSAMGKVARAYAVVVAVLLLVKFGAQVVSYKAIAALEQRHEWLRVLEPLVRPIDVPVWQVCSLVNAFAAWGIYFFSDWQLRKREYDEGWADKTVDYCLSGTILARWGITVYTSFCTLYAIFQIVKNSHPPEWHFRLFQWDW